MSRTYRIRHVPLLPGTAKKYAFGVGNKRNSKTRGYLLKELINILGYEPERSTWYKFWMSSDGTCYFLSRVEHRLYDKLARSVTYPIGHPASHPWFRGLGGITCKKYYRVCANRLARHKVKEKLNHNDPDFDGLMLVTSRNFFDTWDFT